MIGVHYRSSQERLNTFFLVTHKIIIHLNVILDTWNIRVTWSRFSRQVKAIESWLLHLKSQPYSFLFSVFFPAICWRNVFLFRIQYSGPDRPLQGCFSLFQYNKWTANFSLFLFPSRGWILVSAFSSLSDQGLWWKQPKHISDSSWLLIKGFASFTEELLTVWCAWPPRICVWACCHLLS